MPDKQPNLIWICSDHHRADAAGCYGNQVCQTPELDRLAAQGVLFERCFSHNPVCMPARAAMMTGCYSHRTRVVRNGIPLREDLPCAAHLLGREGYQTAAVGKLHLTPEHEGPNEAPYYGFRHVDSVEDSTVGPYMDWVFEQFPEYEGYVIGTLFNIPPHDEYWRGRRDLRREYLAAREDYVLPHEISKTCNWGFGHYSPLPEEAHKNTWITDRALERIAGLAGEAPLFLWVGYVDPHSPFDPPGRYRDMYSADDVDERVRRDGEEDLWPPHHRAFRQYHKRFTEQDWRVLRALFYGSVTFTDNQIGRIIAALESTCDMQNTIVVYTCDHGELLGDHGLCGKNAYHYDSCIRVPLICRWDGRYGRGIRSSEIVEQPDLLPSLFATMGVDMPAHTQGKSFAPLLRGESWEEARGHAYIESFNGAPEDPSPPPVTWARTIRSRGWRATFYPESDCGELFDLRNDPDELYNLWYDPEQRPVIEEHRRILMDRLIMLDFPPEALDHEV